MKVSEFVRSKLLFLIFSSIVLIYLVLISDLETYDIFFRFLSFGPSTILISYVILIILIVLDEFYLNNRDILYNAKIVISIIFGIGLFVSHLGSDMLDPLSGNTIHYIIELLMMITIISSISVEAHYNEHEDMKFLAVSLRVILGITFTITYILFMIMIYDRYLFGRLFE